MPSYRVLNKYHDKKRKHEYKIITKMLAEEARKGGKKVAMNDQDNEIRLTDDEESEMASNINLDHSSSTLRPNADVRVGQVLPDDLVMSLNQSKYFLANKCSSNQSQLSNTLRVLGSKLGEIESQRSDIFQSQTSN